MIGLAAAGGDYAVEFLLGDGVDVDGDGDYRAIYEGQKKGE